MNRTVRLILIACVAVMLASSAAVVWDGVQHPAPLGRGLLKPWFLLGSAIVLAGLIPFMQRQLASTSPRYSDDHRRYAQSAALTWYLFLAAWWAWMALDAYGLAPPSALDRQTFLRLVLIFAGVGMAVRGNFFGKIRPPMGERAPDPGAWTRGALRTGWMLALMGTAIVVAAIALPMRAMLFVLIPVMVGMISLGVAQRRMMRGAGQG